MKTSSLTTHVAMTMGTAATLFAAGPAHAQRREAEPASAEISGKKQDTASLGAAGQWVLGLENLFEVTRTPMHDESTSADATSTTSVRNSMDYTTVRTFWPTLCADYFVVRSLGTGLSLQYAYTRMDQTVVSRIDQGDQITEIESDGFSALHTFAATPRVGYALPLGERFAVWGRLGARNRFAFSRWLNSSDTSSLSGLSGEFSSSQFRYSLGIAASALATYSPNDYLSILAGPGIERNIFEHSSTSNSIDGSQTSSEWVDDPLALSFSVGAAVRL